MGRIITALFLLLVLGFVALTAYAYLGNLAPESRDTRKPVVLNAE